MHNIHATIHTLLYTPFYSLEKDVNKRPKYDDLLKQPFILTSEAEDTDIGVWYRVVMEEAKGLGLDQQ